MNLFKRFFIVVTFSLVTTGAWSYQNDCGNDGQDKGDCEENVGTNPINPYRACIHREVTDLSTFGNAPIDFTRHYISRYRPFTDAKWELGAANVWQHNWNFELRESSLSSFGFKNLILRYPEGKEYIFSAADQSGAVRVPSAEWGDRLYVSQNTFTLITPQGKEFQFQKLGANWYRLQQVRNGQGYVWNLEYDGANRLIKIKNNFNRWIAIERETVNNLVRIKRVYSNDGREVTYHYGKWEPTGETILTSVNYPLQENEKVVAAYTYVGRYDLKEGSPLLASAIDPTYEGNGAKIKYAYNYKINYEPYGFVYGVVLEERNLETDQLIVQLPGGSGIYPQVLEGNGSEVTKKFDKAQLKESWDAEGRKKLFTRTAGGYGYVETITEPNGGITTFQLDYAGRILTNINSMGGQISASYTTKGFISSQKDPLGRVTTYQRDANNLLLKKIYPNNSFAQWTYNADGQPLTYRQRNGFTFTYVYYSENEVGGLKGDLKTATDPFGYVTTYTYDLAGNVASVTDALGHSTQYTYNWRGEVKTTTYADKSQEGYSYDTFGNLQFETNELGYVTSYTYDEYNRVKTITDPLKRTTAYEYGLQPGCSSCADKDTITKITLPSGKRTEYTYDKSGLRLSKIVGAQSEKEQAITYYSYDNGKNLKTITDPNGHSTTYNYDLLHRRTNVVDALGNTTTWNFDLVGNRLSQKLADSSFTTYQYDEMNRMTNTVDANNAKTQMQYDLSDNLTKLIDAKGNLYTYYYDSLNRREGLEYPDSSVEYWNYDKVSNLKTYATREGYSCTYLYDARNRIKESSWDDNKTPATSRTYDVAGRLKTLNHGVSQISYDYDNDNQLTTETQVIAGQQTAYPLSYTYDLDGNRETFIYPNNSQILAYHYDGRNQLHDIYRNKALWVSYEYDKAGNRLEKHLANALNTVSYSHYNTGNQLTQIQNMNENNSFSQLDYNYDKLYRRLSEQRDLKTPETYKYDKIGQLTNAVYPSQEQANYTYDLVGNRQTIIDPQHKQPVDYQVNNLNQYTVINQKALSYDYNGNLASVPLNGGTQTYTYDSQNRLVSASNANAMVQFFYDAGNRCVKRVVNGEATYLIWDEWDLVAEYNAQGQLAASYVTGANLDEFISRTDDKGDNYFYLYNALGNVTHLLSQKGYVVEKYEYDVFGKAKIYNANNQLLSSSAYGNRFLFTGREYLKELSLYDYRNRVYSPELGRFLQTDPIRLSAGDVNIYRYVFNNSVNAIDPLGLDCDCSGGGGCYPQDCYGPPPPGMSYCQGPPPGPNNKNPKPPHPHKQRKGGGGGGGARSKHDLNPLKGTLQAGLTLNFQAGPINGNWSAGIAVDGHGNVGTYNTVGGGTGEGASVSGGLSFAGSNADTIQDLGGKFGNTSVSLGDGLNGSVEAFSGPGTQGQNVTGGGFTVGAGGGASWSTGGSQTWVHQLW